MELKFKKGRLNPKLYSRSELESFPDSEFDQVTKGTLYSFKVLPDTESRIKGGEDPYIVLMDALEFWKPYMLYDTWVLRRHFEIGQSINGKDPRKIWKSLASIEDHYFPCSSDGWWVYINEDKPFKVSDPAAFLRDIRGAADERELNFIITVWKLK